MRIPSTAAMRDPERSRFFHKLSFWRFIPQGDLPVGWGYVLRGLDWVGGHLRVEYLRGGIAFSAVRTD